MTEQGGEVNLEVRKIAVIGLGNMGRQIAMNAAISGFDVGCTDGDPACRESAEAFREEYLASRVTKGRLTHEEAAAVAKRLHLADSISEAAVDADLVIEAVVEVLDVKQKVFRELDEACPEHTILATNSSHIPSSQLAVVTSRSNKVCNMHYFNPALVMKLIEIVRNPQTSKETVDTVYRTAERLGKVPIVCEREIPGFIVNRIREPMVFEAMKLADMGVATVEDIDKAAKYGLGHPMGPFEINDLTGLDLTYTIKTERYRKSGDPNDLPGILLSQHYLKGEYGKKTGKGWYEYGEDGRRK